MRIRRYGIYNARVKRNLNLQFTSRESGFYKLMKQVETGEKKSAEKEAATGENKPHICPYCKQGKMIRLRQLPRIRSPPGHLPSILKSFFYKKYCSGM
jgi:hypothetical protein